MQLLWKSYKFCAPIPWHNSTSTLYPTLKHSILMTLFTFFVSPRELCAVNTFAVSKSSPYRKDSSSQYFNGARRYIIVHDILHIFFSLLQAFEMLFTLKDEIFSLLRHCSFVHFGEFRGMNFINSPTWHSYTRTRTHTHQITFKLQLKKWLTD